MKSMNRREAKIRMLLFAVVLATAGLYLGQGAIVHLRMHLMGQVLVAPKLVSDQCDENNCRSEWLLTPQHRFLLLGHVMRMHTLISEETGEQILPISRVRGITADSWSGLRVYLVEAGKNYRLQAEKPKAVKMGYFIGVLPRSTDHEGVLSVPDISPTISTITSLMGFGLLGILLFAAFVAPSTGMDASRKAEDLTCIVVSSISAVIVAAIGTGLVDSLMPDGDLRSRIVRSGTIVAIGLSPLVFVVRRKIKNFHLSVFCVVASLVFVVNYKWQFFRAGEGWATVYGLVVVAASLYFYSRGQRFAAVLSFAGILDALKIFGLLSVPDMPPINVLQTMLVASFSLSACGFGALSVISLAAKAYQRFTRDIALSQISSRLDIEGNAAENKLSSSVKSTLPLIAQLTGAGRVSILINLPFTRPITHSYNAKDQNSVTYDDGKIPGAVTVRAFVYGDEAWFEKYEDFSRRLGIPSAPHLRSADRVCISPIRVNQTNMGVLMLTCFDDEHIERLIRNDAIDDERETGRLVLDTLASKFSEGVISAMRESSSLSTDLLGRIREAIPASTSAREFLNRYCEAVHQVTGTRTMLHQWEGDRGVAVAQDGFEAEHWRSFVQAPFNLKPNAEPAFGSTVVAFREQKASYVKDWHEISDKLHPKTVSILNSIDACSFMAVPLRSGEERFVVTMVSKRDDRPRDPGVMRIIESTEAIFDAAVTVFNQRASVLALGKLANRLIGDDHVREQIIEAAKQEHLQTTIGTPRTSFLLLFDLVGSSSLPSDTEEKAKSYGVFYDEVNRMVQSRLGGKVRKTIGDAVIVTWDGTNSSLEGTEDLLVNLDGVVAWADRVARDVGCSGVRAVLHHGDYFFGLVGTASFGQIDVIGSGIDEVCKMEGAMKGRSLGGKRLMIAISTAAANRLPQLTEASYLANNYEILRPEDSPVGSKSQDVAWAKPDFEADQLSGPLGRNHRSAS